MSDDLKQITVCSAVTGETICVISAASNESVENLRSSIADQLELDASMLQLLLEDQLLTLEESLCTLTDGSSLDVTLLQVVEPEDCEFKFTGYWGSTLYASRDAPFAIMVGVDFKDESVAARLASTTAAVNAEPFAFRRVTERSAMEAADRRHALICEEISEASESKSEGGDFSNLGEKFEASRRTVEMARSAGDRRQAFIREEVNEASLALTNQECNFAFLSDAYEGSRRTIEFAEAAAEERESRLQALVTQREGICGGSMSPSRSPEVGGWATFCSRRAAGRQQQQFIHARCPRTQAEWRESNMRRDGWRQFFTLEDLQDKQIWQAQNVDPQAREQYLLDTAFLEAFKISKAAFQALPKWRRDKAKKELKLF